METWMLIAAGAAAVVVVVAIVVISLVMRSGHRKSAAQTSSLREGFGPEYERAVDEQGRVKAEQDLLKRQERADHFQVHTLAGDAVTGYQEAWAGAQSRFVDDPGGALTAAGHIVDEVVSARGYPAAEFEQGASALSVDYPRAVQDYRAAHDVALRNQRNPVPTEELREAMLQYHSVFTQLLEGGVKAPPVTAG